MYECVAVEMSRTWNELYVSVAVEMSGMCL